MTAVEPPLAGRREWLGLVVLALPTMLLSLDSSVLLLALPRLSVDLGATGTQQLWISDIYGFMVAGLLVTMSTIGDRLGRRRLLLIGAASFGAVSVIAAFSINAEMLIAARAMLGIAGATLLPPSLALIRGMFAVPRQLSVAITAWTTSFMAGVALGPVVGGILLDKFWWGSAFLLGVPVMLALLVIGPVLLPECRDRASGGFDVPSVVSSLLALLPLVYGLKELARHGWQPVPAAAVLAGLVSAGYFARRQRRLARPLVDPRLFGQGSFGPALAIGLLSGGVQSGNTLLVTQHLQFVEGLSPLMGGLVLIPPAVALSVATSLTPGLVRRFGPGVVLAAGMGLAAVGYLLLIRVSSTGGLVPLVVGVGVVYVGVSPVGTLVNQFTVGSVPDRMACSAAALTSTSGVLGEALGIAMFGTLGTVVYGRSLDLPAGIPAGVAGQARESMGGAVAASAQLPGSLGDGLLVVARDAFTSGLHAVGLASAVILAGLAVVAVKKFRHSTSASTDKAPGAVFREVGATRTPVD